MRASAVLVENSFMVQVTDVFRAAATTTATPAATNELGAWMRFGKFCVKTVQTCLEGFWRLWGSFL